MYIVLFIHLVLQVFFYYTLMTNKYIYYFVLVFVGWRIENEISEIVGCSAHGRSAPRLPVL